MAIPALAAASVAPKPFVAAVPPHVVSLAETAKAAAKQAAAKNDADGDLKSDLASGENPYESLGSIVNAKA